MVNVVATHDPGEDERALLIEMLGELSQIAFLKDLSDVDRSEAIVQADVLLAWNPLEELKPEEYQNMENLQLIQLLSAGADHVPFSLVPPEVTIASNVGAYAEPIAEHVMAMALALAKKLFIKHKKLSNGEFDQLSQNISLKGGVCGILGFGGNGKATARLMRAFGAKIYAINTTGKTDEAVDFIGTLKDLEYVLANSDFVVIALPSSRETRGLIGKRELETMKENAILVNIARGEIINEKALYEHLKNNPDFMIGTDVWWVEPFKQGEFRVDRPFFELPNFLGSPHNSPTVPGMALKATRRAGENILRFIRGEPLRGVVRREDYTG